MPATDVLDIAVTMSRDSEALASALLSQSEFSPESFSGQGFDGSDTLTVALSVSTATLGYLVAILKANWARAKDVEISVGDVKIKGVSPDEVLPLLNKLLRDRSKRLP